MKLRNRIQPFYQAIPKLLLFQIVSSIGLSLLTWAISALSNLLIGLSGKAAVSSGDLLFLFTCWQGYVMIFLVLLMVISYIAVELNALILYCGKILDGEQPSLWRSMTGGFAVLKRFLNPRGLLIVLYAVVISPIIGLGFSISLTETFYIPRFIMSVINANPLFLTGYIILQVILVLVAVIYCFIMHGVLLDDMTMKQSSINSRKLIARNWKNFLFEMLCFFALTFLAVFLPSVVCAELPLLIVQFIPMGETAILFCDVFFSTVLLIIIAFAMMMSVPFLIMKLTTLYKKYLSEGEWHYQKREKRRHPVMIVLVVFLLISSVVFSYGGARYYDEIFPNKIEAGVVAHRAGGFEAPENTVKGIETAYELGATGCEIDIQRTSDGYYVVNHDNDFKRVAGVGKKPSEMTLEEVKELRVDGEPVPTLEEMLDASRDKVTLFVELKGETADNRMADDAVRIIQEEGMQDQAVLISLKYDVLEYIEQKYPEMLTGYLAFISFGKIENTPFDYLALEEEIATDDTIESVHMKGKKLLVWTVNEEDDIERFLTSDADAIITDAVKLSGEAKSRLENRTHLEVIIQSFLDLIE